MSSSTTPIRTRFAPSPTGDLHLGGAWTAIASEAIARRAGGAHVLRVEDIDPPRVVRGSASRILEDLAWLGITWDEGPDKSPAGPFAPYTQSERAPLYEAALDDLAARGLTYPCDCSRAEIARTSRVASAPHAGDESAQSVYPGTCRDADPHRELKRAPAIRLRLPHDARARVSMTDEIMGAFEQNVAAEVGDFVLKRGDDVFAYQLAVVVDDLAMRITDVVRGADLLSSTPRQIVLARMLGAPAASLPRWWHVPLVRAEGERVAKRTRATTVRALRQAGVSREDIVRELRAGLGFRRDGAIDWRTESWSIPERWLTLAGAPH